MLLDWIAGICAGARVEPGPPSDEAGGPAVRLHLLDLTFTEARSRAPHARTHLVARYLVSFGGDDPLVAQDHIGKLAAAALGDPRADLSFVPADPEFWLAFGVAPRPALFLRVPVRLPVERPAVPPVTEQVEIVMQTIGALDGRVVGPGGRGLSGARIALEGRPGEVIADAAGQFSLPGVPTGGGPVDVTIRSGSGEMRARVDPAKGPATISFQPERV